MSIQGQPLFITYIIIGITALVSLYAFSKPDVFRKHLMYPHGIQRNREYYRFVTSGFIHKDHMHLIMNMFSLYFFGTAIESVFFELFGSIGSVYFIALYLLAIIAADIPTYHKQKNNPGYSSLGASGGVAAIIFAFIIFKPLDSICIYFALCMPGFVLGTLYILFSYYQGRKANDGINHDAHLFGALFGLLFCVVLYPSSIPSFFKQIMQWKVID